MRTYRWVIRIKLNDGGCNVLSLGMLRVAVLWVESEPGFFWVQSAPTPTPPGLPFSHNYSSELGTLACWVASPPAVPIARSYSPALNQFKSIAFLLYSKSQTLCESRALSFLALFLFPYLGCCPSGIAILSS